MTEEHLKAVDFSKVVYLEWSYPGAMVVMGNIMN